VQDSQDLWEALGQTAVNATAGYVLSAVVGIALAVILSVSRWIERALYPYAIFFQTVPIVAIAPLLVIWLGYGAPTVRASAFIVSIFPVIANTLSGMLSTDPGLRDLFRLYRATGPARLIKLQLPWALPNIFTGLRIAAGLAVIGAVVGEFVGGAGGIGIAVQVAMREQRADRVLAGVLLASLLGLVLFALVNLASWLCLRRWHASEQNR
jgi:NitT/TauT family transport system permease protein